MTKQTLTNQRVSCKVETVLLSIMKNKLMLLRVKISSNFGTDPFINQFDCHFEGGINLN
jgi:hypothetical protein